MKKKHRDFNIFSLSALDIFCCALGVFMVLCVIVFRTEDSGSNKAEPFFSAGIIWEHQFANAGNVIQTDMHDLDLIVEKEGKRYNSKSGLPTDTKAGHLGDARNTGCEMWISPKVTPGETYAIFAKANSVETKYPADPRKETLYCVGDNDTLRIRLFITRHDGKPELHSFEIKFKNIQKGTPLQLATITVGDNGNLNISYN